MNDDENVYVRLPLAVWEEKKKLEARLKSAEDERDELRARLADVHRHLLDLLTSDTLA